MSALPPKADMCSALANVRYVPIADIALFDHLVGAGEQIVQNCKVERQVCAYANARAAFAAGLRAS